MIRQALHSRQQIAHPTVADSRDARRANRAPRAPLEVDALLRVDDETRQGALRFSEAPGGPYLAEPAAARVPPLFELPRLLQAADQVATVDDDESLRLILEAGSSLGGARPKASLRDSSGRLAIAKFPHPEYRMDLVRWEAVALSLARKAGIAVPDWRIEDFAGRAVLVLRRFDSDGRFRVPFLSAMRMLGAADRETRS